MRLRYVLSMCILCSCSSQQQVIVALGADLAESFKESFASQENQVRRDVGESDESFFGVLHSQLAYDYWAAKEDEITEVLEKRLELIDEEIGLLEEYLEDYDESTGEAMRHLREPKETPEERGKVVGSSAVLGHRMTSRYAGVIADIRRFLSSEDYLKNEDALARILEETQEFIYDEATYSTRRHAPGSEDLFLTMSSFFNVQQIYGYRPSQLIYGFNPSNGQDSFRMNALQCAELGVFALYREEYQIAVEWLEVAQRLLASWEDDEEFNLQLHIVQQLLQFAVQQHNKAYQKPSLQDDLEARMSFYVNPIRPFKKRIPFGELLYNSSGVLGPNGTREAQFMRLCRGETLQTPEMQKSLKCYYERKRHPFLYINPVKVEHLAENPPVFQFYEMMGNETIDLLKSRYRDKVKPTKLSGKGQEKIPHYRTSAYKTFHPEEMPEKVFDLAEAATGIQIRNNREACHFVEYTAGRYFVQHYDSLIGGAKPELGINRHDEWVATILYRLENPESGGLTAYCQAGDTGHPVRGSALLWYNTYHNGTLRSDIYHGSCPVLLGSKITINRWIRYLDNWHNFKCTKNQFE